MDSTISLCILHSINFPGWLSLCLVGFYRLRLCLISLLFSVVVDNGELHSGSWQRIRCVGLHSEVGWHCEF